MKRNKIKTVLILLIIIILCLSVGVYAGYQLSATEVRYTKSDGTTITVKEALDELRAKTTTDAKPATNITEAQSDIMLTKLVSSTVLDEAGNKIVIPAGYKLRVDATTNNATTVDKGMVIEDSKGNQYVWIPCTTDTTSSQLQFQRTEWWVEGNGTDDDYAKKDELTLADSTCSEDDITNGLTEEVKTAIINQVKLEKASINKYGGYYIGRYEVGKDNNTAVIKANQQPYAEIIWSKAYELANGIGGGTAAETHLCSSYAWDTAINFIQNTSTPNYATSCDGMNENWKDREVVDSKGNVIKPSGTAQRLNTGLTTAKTNIYDMGGNEVEFTTEVNPGVDEAVVRRGESYYWISPAGYRFDTGTTTIGDHLGLRATLFLK